LQGQAGQHGQLACIGILPAGSDAPSPFQKVRLVPQPLPGAGGEVLPVKAAFRCVAVFLPCERWQWYRRMLNDQSSGSWSPVLNLLPRS
jgi:hypothetical protein